MNLGDWIQTLAAAATVLLLLAAASSDIARYRIPNGVVYAIVAVFCVGVAFNLSWSTIGWSVLAGVGMFLLGAGFFAFGLFGGGDVKLIAAMALWTGVADLPRFLLVMGIAGGLLSAVWIIKRRRRPAMAAEAPGAPTATSSQLANSDGLSTEAAASGSPSPAKIANRVPYGVAIALAGLDFFVMSPRSPFAPLWPWMS
jgi:prepilin peptidase CpaA